MHKQVENYLAEVERHCVSLPKPKRDDELKEMRQHLLNAVSVHQESGQPEDEAVANALTEFGTAEEASVNILWAWQRLLRKNGIKTFWKIEGIWSALAAFNFLFMSPKMEDRMIWFYFWLITMIVGFLLMVLPPYLRPEVKIDSAQKRRKIVG